MLPVRICSIGEVEDWLMVRLQRDLAVFLRREIERKSILPDISRAFDQNRNQFNSTQIIKEILETVDNEQGKILAVVDKDLFIPILTFVFGEAQLGGMISLISLTRLRETFYGMQKDDEIFYQRVFKESLHELGHNFALTHCESWSCVMHSCNLVEQIDIRGGEYCADCSEAIFKEQTGEERVRSQ